MLRKAWQHWNTPLGVLYPNNEFKKMFVAGATMATGAMFGLFIVGLAAKYVIIPLLKAVDLWPW